MADQISQAEQLLMLAIIRSHPNAYGVSIFDEIAKTGKEMPIATIYASLDKLVRKGLVSSKRGMATAERGGRAKMYFEIMARGRHALAASLRVVDQLRDGIEIEGITT